MRVAVALAAGLMLLAGGPAWAAAREQGETAPTWAAAEEVRQSLFDAQLAAAGEDEDGAQRAVGEARRALRGALGQAVEGPAGREVRAALRDAGRSAGQADSVGLAASRGRAEAALLGVSFERTLAAAARGDVEEAQEWLLLRDFRTATRFTRPGVGATVALDNLRARRISPAEARLGVAKDLLDAYQARLRELLTDADRAGERGFAPARAEATARAAGYWRILRSRYAQDRGDGATRAADGAFAALAGAGAADDPGAYAGARAAVDRTLDGFVAAPITPEEQARRAAQLSRFLALVPIEYRDGTQDGRVTIDFEIQEAVAFLGGADAAFADLTQALRDRDPRATAQVAAGLEELAVYVDDAASRRRVVDEDRVTELGERTLETLEAMYPEAWKDAGGESDFDLVALSLDNLEQAVSAGQYTQAEQARLEAYAFFEFGPELRLNSLAPGIVGEVEGLVWFGAQDREGLARLIAQRAPAGQVRETRAALDEALEEARVTLGDGASDATIVTNAAIIVFREGLEAVLILAAITAGLVGVRARHRRPVLIGAALGLVASVATWFAAQLLLGSLAGYGEKLEAVVGLVAIGVLLLVMNWFFHRVYWTSWISGFHQRRRKLLEDGSTGFFSAQVLGLGTLGLTSVYREGFETVLFLQSLELSAGTLVVVAGAGLGLALVSLVAVATFALQRKLPYKRMLVVTGVLLGFVLVVLVGQTARTLQGVAWLAISPLAVELPFWAGTWLGLFPTWQTLGAQALAAAFVVGSYFAAEYVRIKRPRRLAAARRADAGVPS